MKDFIKVRTPFNINKFESLLKDHPNQPFVKSVMTGLREGFWLFHKGEWEELHDDCKENFLSEEKDLEAHRVFQDKEIDNLHWSPPLPITVLPPGMSLSPMFIVWQHEKPHVVTNH